MRATLLLLCLFACKTDADGDGAFGDDDCDDADASAFPSAVETCDGVDNDCDGVIDDDASDATAFYADVDADGHGDGDPTLACAPPDGTVTLADDCDDADPDAFTGNVELCDGVDNDCDGDVDGDATDLSTFYADADGDGYGDPESPVLACTLGEGLVDDATDCDDDAYDANPGAVEVCDGLDNDCAGGVDEGLDGTDAACPAPDCASLVGTGWTSGPTWLDPGATGVGTEIYCDMTTDGGGWTLLSWNGGNTSGVGVPYPGLSVCAAGDCLRGSSAGPDVLEPLIQGAASLAVGHTTGALTSFQDLGDYTYAGRYDYGTLVGYQTAVGAEAPSCAELASGPYHAIVGDPTYDGTLMYVAIHFTYAAGYYTYADGSEYIWNIGAPSAVCDGSGAAPGTWLGDWGQPEFGPILANTYGARSVWAR